MNSQFVLSILSSEYGITGEAFRLPGDVDLNYRIDVNGIPQYIFKVVDKNAPAKFLDFQEHLLLHLKKSVQTAPKTILTKDDKSSTEIKDIAGNIRNVRVLTWIPGRLWSSVNPQLDHLRASLGHCCGSLSKALTNYDHPYAKREFEWDIAQGHWTKQHIQLFDGENKEVINYFLDLFAEDQKSYSELRKQIIHNDANDNNILVSEDLEHPKVYGLIDFGDAIHSQVINDVAIACAYAILDYKEPLEAALPIVSGYNEAFPLQEEELQFLYVCIGMRLVISVTKSALNKVAFPDNEYLSISEKPAWELLRKWRKINDEYAHFAFRESCGYPSHPNEEAFLTWAEIQQFSLKDLFRSLPFESVSHIDMSVASSWLGNQSQFNDLDYFQYQLKKLENENPKTIFSGGYLEPRPLYTSDNYKKWGNNGRQHRCVHLGVDYWADAGTEVWAILDGEVVSSTYNPSDKDYGGLIILKHEEAGLVFYSLYGHLSENSKVKIGSFIKKGDRIGTLGNPMENGNWVPHLHFQLMLSMLDFEDDFPGAAFPEQANVWSGICPDPSLLFNYDLDISESKSAEDLLNIRKKHLGKSLSLAYNSPIHIVRGEAQYLIDRQGYKYLDTVNNVAHVGHEHPTVVNAGQQQMALLNTNTRYLHKTILEFTQEILKTLPPELNRIHLVNSGSEANELAIRMAKAYTGRKDILACQHGYHGNTNMCVDISSYKFEGKGGFEKPAHTHIIPIPDAFRGIHQGQNAGSEYVRETIQKIQEIEDNGGELCAFIIESIISCGGQIELPNGFLKEVFTHIREVGGLCIVDEVQVGCGRVGSAFWGFEFHDVVPDIVTIGKPIGNGHPLAVVACTEEVAERFDNGMEYFNTFGGNPVSAAIGTEVLRVIKREKLQENALRIGSYLKEKLKMLTLEYPIIGDVRGQGLFLGFELVDKKKTPLPKQTKYLANRMKDHKIFISVDGPDHNVIKIKPPMVFSKEDADEVLEILEKVFIEDYMKI